MKEKQDELFGKFLLMSEEIMRLLKDDEMMHWIGEKDFSSFKKELLQGILFYHHSIDSLDTLRGHKLSVIRYYCDTFNMKGKESERK